MLKSVKPQTFETRLGGLKIYILWLIISRRFGWINDWFCPGFLCLSLCSYNLYFLIFKKSDLVFFPELKKVIIYWLT